MRFLRSRRARSALFLSILGVSTASSSQHVGRILHRPLPGDLTAEELTGPTVASAPSTASSVAQAAGTQTGWNENQPIDQGVERPRAGWEAPSREMDRTTRSSAGTRLSYREVFTPSIQPFKRGSAMDMVDELGRLTVRDPALRPLTVNSDPPAHWAGHRVAHFVGDTLIELNPSAPTPLAGVGGEQRLLRYSTSDGEPVSFFEDGAGNWFVRAERGATVRLQYAVEAPETTFAAVRVPATSVRAVAESVPADLRPNPPTWLAPRAQRVMDRLNLHLDDPFDQVLARLVGHFRGFRDAELPAQTPDLYTDLALGGVGACRHRAYAMMLTLQAMGVPARYVGNEAHAWVEVWLEASGWARVDLGGWDVPLDTENASDRRRFEAPVSDPFPRPETYEHQFSAAADHASTTRRGGDGGVWRENASSSSGAESGANSSRSQVGARATATAVSEQALTRAASRAQNPEENGANSSSAATQRLGTVTQISQLQADPQAGFASREGFVRGSMVRVNGTVRDSNGDAATGMAVEFQLMRHGHQVQTLGTAATNEQGEFIGLLLIPAGIDTGEYSLRAVTQADAQHASSSAE